MFEHSPIVRRISEIAATTPDKIALIADDAFISYKTLLARILAAAHYIQSKGFAKGDCVALTATKKLDFIYTYFGAHVADVTVVVVDPESNPKKMDYILGLTKPRATIAYEDIDFDSGKTPVAVAGASDQDVADIVFTTGTTGNPKGVCLSHFNIYSSAANINEFIGNGSDEIEVLGLPLCHSFGLGRLRCTFLKGATMVVVGSFANVRAFFAAIEKHHATGFGMVPAVWAYIRKISGTRIAKYAPQIKYIEIGSAAMPLASKQELCQLFPTTRICHHYGLTEASRSAFMEYHSSPDLNTIGKEVCDKVEIKVFDENGAEMPQGQSGEICVKGNMVMKGYFLAEETATAFVNGYFRTGDEGYRAADGNLYLVSRKKEMINVGGKKVSPVEVEDMVLSMGGIEDCGCIGIPDPNGIMGEVPKLFVQQPGCTRTLDEISAFLKTHLEIYKQPVAYEWIDSIPKTSSGKKQRLQLRR